MRRVGLLTICVLAVGSSLGVGSSSNQTVDYWIVFGSFRDGDFAASIHAIRPDGSAERELSLHDEGRPASLDPSSAPDESLILFTRGGADHRSAVWSLDPRAREERVATPHAMVRFNNGRAWPSLRPEHPGEFIYVREVGGSRSLTLGRLGSDEIDDLGVGEFPSWSPDGARLTYVRDSQVWVQTPGAGDAKPLGGTLAETSYPSWSPGGDALLVSGSDGAGVDLYEVGLDGTVLRRLTHTADVIEAAAVWSPDGTRIAFSAGSAAPADGWQHSIFVLDLEGERTREITSGRFHDSRPTWTSGREPEP